MSKSLNLLILGLTLITCIEFILCQKYQCDKESETTDVLVTDNFLFAALSRKFPTNQNEMKSFCRNNTINEGKIQNHINKCMNNLTKRLASLLLYSITKTNANICRSRRRSANFVELGRCGNAGIKENRKCWTKWLRGLNGVVLVDDHKLKMPLSCCLTYRLKSCFMQTFERNSKHCSQKTMNGLEALFGSYVTDTMGLICGDFNEENDKCDKILPKIPSIKKKGSSNSPIAILSDIFNSFPDTEV